jgi:hypothetical protein
MKITRRIEEDLSSDGEELQKRLAQLDPAGSSGRKSDLDIPESEELWGRIATRIAQELPGTAEEPSPAESNPPLSGENQSVPATPTLVGH